MNEPDFTTDKSVNELLDEAAPRLIKRLIYIAEVGNDVDAIRFLLNKRMPNMKPETARVVMKTTAADITLEQKCHVCLMEMTRGEVSLEAGTAYIDNILKMTTFDDQRARDEVLNQLAILSGHPRHQKPRSFL